MKRAVKAAMQRAVKYGGAAASPPPPPPPPPPPAATWDASNKQNTTLTNGALTAGPSGWGASWVKATRDEPLAGDHSVTFTFTNRSGHTTRFGLVSSAVVPNNAGFTDTAVAFINEGGNLVADVGGAEVVNLGGMATGDSVTMRVKNGKLYVSKNGGAINPGGPYAGSDPADDDGIPLAFPGEAMPAMYFENPDELLTANFAAW